MIKAFVFGKFLPFHKGHEAMINFALSNCDFLTVLVCCSNKENIPANKRSFWISKTFEKEEKIEVRVYQYMESELPNTSVSSLKVSQIWAEIFMAQFPDYSLLITSEPYGFFVANIMNIKHISFDQSKEQFPISATRVRKDIFANWSFLPNSVKPDYSFKVVILGTESTGKTCLTKKLAKYFRCSFVSEAARDIIPTSNYFTIKDLQLVASEHVKKIDEAVLGDSALVIIDTDIHITKSYCKFTFGKELEVSAEIYDSNKANVYLYLKNDVEYIQDGTRLVETERNLLDFSHRQVLKEHKIDFIEIMGSWDERFEFAVRLIESIIASKD